MKEKIYTIPVNEAFSQNDLCPLCYLRKKLEAESVDYALGGAMMEPDYRIISNEKGYCNCHYEMMLSKKEKLSLALVLDTHLEETRKTIDEAKKYIDLLKTNKKSLFKKNISSIDKLADVIFEKEKTCVICEKLDSTMERYIGVLFCLWDKDADFREKIANSGGLCLPHMGILIKKAPEYLSNKKAIEFIESVYNKEQEELQKIQTNVHKFTLKFDYRSRGEKWGEEIDAPKRAIESLSGYLKEREK